MGTCVVHRRGGTEEVLYTLRDGSWQVMTPADTEYWRFASQEASELTVKQLIRKKWCSRYSVHPDDFTDRD